MERRWSGRWWPKGPAWPVSARRAEALEAQARSWRDKGADVRAFPLDVTDRAATQSVVAAIEQAFGRVDVAVLNAGTHVLGTKKPFDAQQFIDNMHLNYVGMLYGIEAVLPGMLARGRGHIAGVSSLAGLRALPTAGGYGASKAAASYMLDAIRFDLEPRGVLVTNITPGFVKTPLTDRNRYRMPFLMEVDRAADILVDGLERGQAGDPLPEAVFVDRQDAARPALPALRVDHPQVDRRQTESGSGLIRLRSARTSRRLQGPRAALSRRAAGA